MASYNDEEAPAGADASSCGARSRAAVLAGCVVLDDELHFAGHGDLGAERAANERRAQLVDLDLKVGRDLGQDILVRASGGRRSA